MKLALAGFSIHVDARAPSECGAVNDALGHVWIVVEVRLARTESAHREGWIDSCDNVEKSIAVHFAGARCGRPDVASFTLTCCGVDSNTSAPNHSCAVKIARVRGAVPDFASGAETSSCAILSTCAGNGGAVQLTGRARRVPGERCVASACAISGKAVLCAVGDQAAVEGAFRHTSIPGFQRISADADLVNAIPSIGSCDS